MHIPDGFIADPRIWGGCFVLAAPVLILAARRSREALEDRAALLPGLTGAFLFAAQMFNFPIAGGTSGHLVGGVLACALLGGWTGMLVTALVLTIQCLLFQDGGITALGANVLNMAVIGGGGAFLLYRLFAPMLKQRQQRLILLGLVAGGGVVLSAAAAALEIGLSGVVPLPTVLTAMISVHFPIGLVEGLATASVVGALEQLRPDLARGLNRPPVSFREWAPVAVGIVSLALLAVGFASSHPDGLEHVARLLGFESRAVAALPAPLPDYALGDHRSYLSRAAVALIGLGVIGGGLFMVSRLLRRHREIARG